VPLVNAGCRYLQTTRPSPVKPAIPGAQLPERATIGATLRSPSPVGRVAARLGALHKARCRSQNLSCRRTSAIPSPSAAHPDEEADTYFLDHGRAGTFEPLRSVPAGKFVVLGLVASKVADVESIDLLKRRIEEATRYIKLEQLGLSPQCGFSTSAAEHVVVNEEIERAKLARVVEVARDLWGPT
jgi:5-methyltetrahydropteroyltriglutamate--homocysteine methyltransferase